MINKIQDTRPFGVLDYIPWVFSCTLHCGSNDGRESEGLEKVASTADLVRPSGFGVQHIYF